MYNIPRTPLHLDRIYLASLHLPSPAGEVLGCVFVVSLARVPYKCLVSLTADKPFRISGTLGP